MDHRPFQAETLAINLVRCGNLTVAARQLVDFHILCADIDRLGSGRQAALDDPAEFLGFPEDLSRRGADRVNKAAVIGNVDAVTDRARGS